MSGGAAQQEVFKIGLKEALKEVDDKEEEKVDGQAKASQVLESVFGADAEEAVSYDGEEMMIIDENGDMVKADSIVKEVEMLNNLQE